MNGAGPAPDPAILRPGQARRRLFLLDVASGESREVGPPDTDVWEFDWDGGGHQPSRSRPSSHRADPVGTARTSSDWTWTRAPRRRSTSRRGRSNGSRSRRMGDAQRSTEGYASDHGFLSGSVKMIDLVDGTTSDPWPDLETVGIAGVDRRRLALVLARRRDRDAACGRIWLDGRREERWRGDAFIGDEVTTPVCVVRRRRRRWCGRRIKRTGSRPSSRGSSTEPGEWSRFTSFNDDIVDGHVFPDARTDPVERARTAWRSRACCMTPRGAQGPLPLIMCVHGGPTWNWGAFFSDSEPNAVLLASAGYACLMPNPRGSIGRGHAFAQGVIGDGGRDRLPRHHGRRRPLHRRGHRRSRTGSGSPVCRTAGTWRDGRSGRPIGSARRSRCPWSSNYVSFHLTSEVWMVRPGDPEGGVERPGQPVRGSLAGDTRASMHDAHADPPGSGGSMHAARPGRGALPAIAAAGAETELVVYPREGHVPLERAHALDAIRRTQAWFDRHLHR